MTRHDADRWLRIYDHYRSECIRIRYLYKCKDNWQKRKDLMRRIIIADARMRKAATKLNIDYNPYEL